MIVSEAAKHRGPCPALYLCTPQTLTHDKSLPPDPESTCTWKYGMCLLSSHTGGVWVGGEGGGGGRGREEVCVCGREEVVVVQTECTASVSVHAG